MKSSPNAAKHTVAMTIWLWLGIALCLATGCAANTSDGGGAPQGGTTSASGPSSTVGVTQSVTAGSTSGDPVSGCETDDAFCDWPKETCSCGDCKARSECGYQPCVNDGMCSNIESCQCPDCRDECPYAPYCEVDGDCIPEEWCGCKDCWEEPLCEGFLDHCDDAIGTCGETEPCDCPDCLLAPRCVVSQCMDDGVCKFLDSFQEWCICADCQQDPKCNNAVNCADDGLCDFYENCNCADCVNVPGCSHPTCSGPPNGVCAADEPCSCVDCFDKEACIACVNDGVCGGFEGCICPDCEGAPGAQNQESSPIFDWSTYCYPNSGPLPCVNDGVCRPLSESCGCADCFSSSWCSDNVASCVGGAPNNKCDTSESCLCPDCFWGGECALSEGECDGDGVCEAQESFLCAECAASVANCELNGFCHDWHEGCDCPDCSGAPTCP